MRHAVLTAARRLVRAATAGLALTAAASAQTPPSPPPFSPPTPPLAQDVPAVCAGSDGVAGRLVALEPDGSVGVFAPAFATPDVPPNMRIRLADIDMPDPTPPRLAAARQLIERWVGRDVVLYRVAAQPDRWQRTPAHLALTEPAGWLQSRLVHAGLARVRPGDSLPGCAAALYPAERLARRARRGLWAQPELRVRAATDHELVKAVEAYRIVAGIVVSVGATSRTHYLNFGRDWSRDFTVTVPARRSSDSHATGQRLEMFTGRRVRVRGWMRKWNGAAIEIRHPDQIELVETGG